MPNEDSENNLQKSGHMYILFNLVILNNFNNIVITYMQYNLIIFQFQLIYKPPVFKDDQTVGDMK